MDEHLTPPGLALEHGDCMELLVNVKDHSIDMILTDPPYGTTAAEWDIAPDMAKLWEHWKRVIKPNGAIVVFSQLPFAVDVINANRAWYRYEWVWVKDRALGFLNACKMPMRAHENILVFYDGLPTYNEQRRKGFGNYVRKHSGEKQSREIYGDCKDGVSRSDDGTRHAIDVIAFSNMKKDIHPTGKPIDVLQHLIRTYTNEGETVLDCFMGGGSTGVACWKEKRKFIGMEKETRFFTAAKERICTEAAQMSFLREAPNG